jgi:hypothetical protein
MIEYLPLVLTGIGIIASILYYSRVLRNANKTQQNQLETRQAQLFMNIYETYSSKQYQKDRERMFVIWEFEDFDDFFNKYGADVNPEDHAIWDMFTSHFEGIGVLVKRGLIDSSLVYDLMYGSIIRFWDKFEPILLGLRELSGPKTWEDIEFLKNEMLRLQEQENRE